MPPASIMRASRCCTAAISSTSARRRRLYCDCDGSCGNQPGRTLATKPRNWRSEQMPIAAWQTARATSSASATSGRRPGRAGTGYSSAKTYAAITRASRSIVISSLHLEGHVWKPSFALRRRVPARNPPFHIKPLVLELVRLRAEHLEPRLEEVVRSGRTERPGQQPAEARREHLARRERRCAPGSDAAWAGHELAERTPEGRSSSPVSASPSTNGCRTKLATRSRESVRDVLNVAAESATRSSAVPAGARRATAATVAIPPRKTPAIAA